MTEYQTTVHYPRDEFVAPEGFYFKSSHVFDGNEDGDYIVVIWEGQPTPSSLVKLCNQIVRAGYAEGGAPAILRIIADIERELDAHGLREPT